MARPASLESINKKWDKYEATEENWKQLETAISGCEESIKDKKKLIEEMNKKKVEKFAKLKDELIKKKEEELKNLKKMF